MTGRLVCIVLALAVLGPGRVAPGGTKGRSAPAAKPDKSTKDATTKKAPKAGQKVKAKAKQEKQPPKCPPATPEQIEACRKKAQGWAAETKKFVKNLHQVETKHFLIYSPWNRSGDRKLARVCEKMYKTMCRQFDIPAKENFWVGKCPIFIFDRDEDFVKFCTDVAKRGNPKAAGWCAYDSTGFVFIAMNRCRNRTRFYEVLVHEASHGFVWRYLAHRSIPSWVSEGLAEYMAATLVPKCYAARNYKTATKEAVRKKKDISGIFKEVRLESFDYGIAQSLVRLLIAKDRKGFVKFVTLLKQGKAEAEALEESFGVTHKGLQKAWWKKVSKAVR